MREIPEPPIRKAISDAARTVPGYDPEGWQPERWRGSDSIVWTNGGEPVLFWDGSERMLTALDEDANTAFARQVNERYSMTIVCLPPHQLKGLVEGD